jgi:hypothetical protein
VAVALSAGVVAAFVLMSRGAATVRLSVVTEPPGATLSRDGVQVCDKTPCEVLTAPHETVELVAVKAALRGNARLTAERDQRVSIRLTAAGEAPK